MEEKKEIKKYDREEAKKEALSAISFPDNKDALLKELTQDIIPKCLDSKDKDNEVIQKKFKDKSMLLLRIFENESHIGLMESFNEKYQMFARELATNMIREHNCSNETEKALAELAANAYIRVIDNSRRLNNLLEMNNANQNINGFFSILSKQIDRANRQYISALLTLKQLKAPQIEMNIKTNTAFISNNQQVNVNKDENIKA